MKRNEFLKNMGLVSFSSIFLGGGLLTSCSYTPKTRRQISENDIPLLNELAEDIIPKSKKAPGAKEAGVGAYIVKMVNACMDTDEQVAFIRGLNDLDTKCATMFNKSYIDINNDKRLKLLYELQEDAITYALEDQNLQSDKIKKPHFFDLLKKLTIAGYYTSKIGMTIARDYIPVPGKYTGCMDYDPQKSRPWAI